MFGAARRATEGCSVDRPNPAVNVHATKGPADVVIIGAGAAGLMCALTAGRRGRRVVVLEHARKVGRKILMSGGGRCNFTNMYTEPDNFLSRNPHFCKSALSRFTQWDFIALVEQHGIAYHEKEAGQLFCDESSKQILKMLLDECAAVGVDILTQCEIRAMQAGEDGFQVNTSQGNWHAASVVVATGGLSIPKMGATGLGYQLAEQFGHTLEPTRAALVPFTLSGRALEDWQALAGLSADVRLCCDGHAFAGALLITHRGFSGPAVLQLSSYWREGRQIEIDWLPQLDAVDALLRAKRDEPRLTVSGWLTRMLPKRLAQRLVALMPIAEPLGQITDERLRRLGESLKAWPISPSGTEGYRTAEVTLGGVSTRQLSSRTMESKLQPGLFFVGEVVDVTGHLGGFNFQWAWASGHAAGQVV